jgi:mRNA interferase MazF
MSRARSASQPSRGEVWTVNLDPTVGHEQSRGRPGLVVSDNALNRSPADLVILAPITSTDRGIPAHIHIPATEAGLIKPSMIMADQIRTLSKLRLGRRLGRVSPMIMAEVDACLRLVLGL